MNDPSTMLKVTEDWFTRGWLGEFTLAGTTFADALTTNGSHAGPSGAEANVRARLIAFPDLKTEVMTLLVSGDTVTVQVRWSGTHREAYAGIAPSGRPVDVRVISVWRFADNKVVENWTLQDQFGLLQQVGYLPAELTSAQVRRDRQPTT